MEQIHYIYKITNLINNKIYIGQSKDVDQRWRAHRAAVKNNKPTQTVHFALIKYGIENFMFEIIASCLGQDAANEAEELCIKQLDCLVSNGRGYNYSLGGSVAPKSKEWKEAIKKWRNSLSEEEKQRIKNLQSQSTKQQIATKGHPAQGTKRTEEQKAKMSLIQQSIDRNYSEEIRQKMSQSHLGEKHSPETIEKQKITFAEAIKKRTEERTKSGEYKCNAPECNKCGDIKYAFYNGIRYCHNHGQKLKRSGTLEYVQKNYSIG